MGGAVVVSLADIITARRDRRRELRAELTPLEQDIATDEMRRLAYLEGLRRERAGVEVELIRLRHLRAESREWQPGDPLARGEPPTAAERVASAERRVADIDAEIARVGG